MTDSFLPTDSVLRERDYFRPMLDTSVARADSVRRVMLVGAKTRSPTDRILSDRDRGHLYDAFQAALRTGMTIAPDFELDIVNIHPDFGGRSFFDEDRTVDMVVVCFVYNPAAQGRELNPDRFVDRRCARPGIWHESAVRVGARVVTTVIGQHSSYFQTHISEVNHRHFLNVPESRFIQADNYDGASHVTTLRRHDVPAGFFLR